MLYTIIIYPIELIIELTYLIFKKILRNPGLAIIGVSLAVQILTLPLYSIAEKWQKLERDTQARLKPKVDKIKAVFKGDEQYMILSTYYKQNNYHPIFAMRSTIGLLIQIPFFIAAYHFLSNLESLSGSSFFFIHNLGSPDGLFSIGTYSINMLPIVMTAINILSALVYTKGFSIREKAQLYGMSIIFLILLYNSPSALVLYWTLNNFFSLIKNLIAKTKNPLKLFYILSCCAIGIAAVFYLFFIPNQSMIRKLFVFAVAIVIISIPLCVKCIVSISNFFLPSLQVNTKKRNILFFLATVSLAILSGLFIPSSLIATSVQEFSFIETYDNPIYFIFQAFLQSIGFFLFWIPLLYLLFSDKVKNILTWIALSLFIVSVMQTFIIIGDYGLISSSLQFETGIPKMPKTMEMLLDGIVLVLSLIIPLLLIKLFSYKISLPVFSIACTTLFLLSLYNIISIQSNFQAYKNTRTDTINITSEAIYNVSQTEKNVIIIMLDRAISSFVPIMFAEKPELKEQFNGFTYYPNTLSVNGHTLMGAPPLYGGYEYLPTEINKRENETLVSKHNESLSVLPVLFSDNGFTTTITDASWANYSYIPDNRIFSAWPEITAKNIVGSKSQEWTHEQNIDFIKQSNLLERNLLLFSIFRMVPSSLRGALYDNGKWWEEQNVNPDLKNYINNFSALDYLPKLTNVSNKTSGFNLIVNEATHNSLFLQYPDYIPANTINNTGNNVFSDEYSHKTYHVNMGSFIALGNYFDFLRENNAYDNTKIIIVSDHGSAQHLPAFIEFTESEKYQSLFPERFNSLLLVKDFYIQAPVKINMSFMTNADVPSLATENLIDDAHNPFSDLPFSQDAKKDGIDVYITPRYTPEQHNKNTFILDGETWHVNDNIFEPSNWSKVQ